MLNVDIYGSVKYNQMVDSARRTVMELYSNLQEGGIRGNRKQACTIDFKEQLKKDKLTQIAVAKLAGVGIKVVYSISNGEHISEQSAQKVAKALDIPMNKLFAPVKGTDKPLAGKTVLHHHRLISSILEKAVKWQILYSNPCERVEVPKVERKEARYLDEKQAATLLEYLEKEPLQYRTIITLFLYSGMRRGELCGLEWSDIDFDKGIIDINKGSLYLPGKGVFEDSTKNFSSQRVIRLPAPIIELLAEHKKEQNCERFRLGDKWENSKKLFTQWDGKPIHPDTTTAWFGKFIKRNSLPPVSIHSLRHTNATLLIANGTDLRTVSKRLGHSNMTTTGNIYTHAIQTADERAADALGDILSPAHKSPAMNA
jgi:integrase